MTTKIDKKCYQCHFFKCEKTYSCTKKKEEIVNPFEKSCRSWKYWFDERTKGKDGGEK